MPYTPSRQLVTQDVDLSGSTTAAQSEIVDLVIPTGQVVVGSGAVITHVDNGSGPQPIDQLSNWADLETHTQAFSGPHPSDSTKWRFQVTNTAGGYGTAVRFRVWLVAINAS